MSNIIGMSLNDRRDMVNSIKSRWTWYDIMLLVILLAFFACIILAIVYISIESKIIATSSSSTSLNDITTSSFIGSSMFGGCPFASHFSDDAQRLGLNLPVIDRPSGCSFERLITEYLNQLHGNMTETTKWVTFGKSQCRDDIGRNDVDYTMNDELLSILLYDMASQLDIVLFPGVNGTFPTNIIGPASPFLTNNTLSSERWGKMRSISYALGYFANVDMATVDGTDYTLPLLLKDLEDRGYDDSSTAKRFNLEKRQYWQALTGPKVVNRYAELTRRFIDKVFRSITVYKKPVLSAFDDHMLDYFMDIHIGSASHPPFIKEWFYNFSYVIASWDPQQHRNASLLSGHANAECVRDYYRSRAKIVMNDGLTDTLMWYWMQAGMSIETVVNEAILNVAAFRHYINMMELIIKQSINPGDATGNLRYFDIYRTLTTETEQINFVREVYRKELPANAWYSRDLNTTGPDFNQAIHLPALIQLVADDFNLALSMFNISRYGVNFDATFSAFIQSESMNSEHVNRFDYNDTTEAVRQLVKDFTVSVVDNETAVPPGQSNMIPVFENPIFAAFGLGYRRCPAEILNVFVVKEMFDVFKCLQFYDARIDSPSSGPWKYIPLGPFKFGVDAYFVNQTTLASGTPC